MAKRVGGLQTKVLGMIRHSRGLSNSEIRRFLAKSPLVASGSGGSNGGVGSQYPEQALTIGGEYLTLGGEYLLME